MDLSGITWPEATIILGAIGGALGLAHRWIPEKRRQEVKVDTERGRPDSYAHVVGGINVHDLKERVVVLEVKDLRTEAELTKFREAVERQAEIARQDIARVHERIDGLSERIDNSTSSILDAIAKRPED